MKKKQVIAGLIAVALFVSVGITSVVTNTWASSQVTKNTESFMQLLEGTKTSLELPDEDYIAKVNVVGTIQQQTEQASVSGGYRHDDTMKYIDEIMNDKKNKGILLYVDSPGGAVYESEELYLKIEEYKQKTSRPVWVYMAHYAASGGYMASVTGDKIFANPNTTTGSIGVIMSGYDLSGLYEKLGIRYVSITSGENKDSSKMTDEQIKIYQSQVDECYQDFVDKVVAGRGLSEEDVKKLADGRTYSAKQALKNGLIDEISLFDDMKTEMSAQLVTDTIFEPTVEQSLFSKFFSKASELVPKSETQILKETADGIESGVLMYYAEQ